MCRACDTILTLRDGSEMTGQYPCSAWKKGERKRYIMNSKLLADLAQFIQESPSGYHAVRSIRRRLDAAGFSELEESSEWKLAPGQSGYVIRNGSSIIAFRLPEDRIESFHIVASHSDSPTFKLKPEPVLTAQGAPARLNVEAYGGMIRASWFDRPLSVAGRVLVDAGEKLEQRLVSFDRDLVMIPSLAIHLSRGEKEPSGAAISVQKELLPLLGDGMDNDEWLRLLCEQAETEPERILGADLFLTCRMPASVWGAHREYFSAPRLDDLACVHASLEGFLNAEVRGHAAIYCVFDNEEVGSRSMQGAESTFLSGATRRLLRSLGADDEAYDRAVAGSFLISADNAHACHPGYPEKYDPVNRPRMNGGLVLKHQAGQRYTTDAVSEAVFKRLCKQHEIPYQEYVNHSDVPGGSTLGNISNTQLSVRSADIGLAQLAMHAAYETMGAADAEYLARFAEVFYREALPQIEGI